MPCKCCGLLLSFHRLIPFSILRLQHYNRFCMCDTKGLYSNCSFLFLFYGTPFNILQIQCNLKIVLFSCLKLLSYCHNNSHIIFRMIIGRQNACISEHQSHRDDVNSLSINVLLPYDTKCKKSITDKSLRNSNIHQCESVLNEIFMISKYMPPKLE